MTSFSELSLLEPLRRALADEGYTTPTPIQAEAIPPLLRGADLLGCARTGTGKTAAFALPTLQRLFQTRRPAARKSPRCLVVVPTRELAAQVAQSFQIYGRHLGPTVATVFGGVGQGPQVKALARGVDVLVATPGRLLDLLEQRHVELRAVEVLVLDEADQMLDLGFLPDVKRILAAVPARRQTLLFSATMPKPIEELAQRVLRDPVKVYVTPVASTTELVDQRVRFVPRDEKCRALAELLRDPAVRRVLVFTRTKRGCDRVAKRLVRDGIAAQAIHGDKSQGNRDRVMAGFRAGKVRVLVATDIAARGIDVDDVTHVVNYEIPNVPETYVHRIGRTARAGAAGMAVTLCSPEERELLRDIERLIRRSITVLGPDPREARGGRREASAREPARANGSAAHRNRNGRADSAGRGARPERRSGARGPGRRPGAGQRPHPGGQGHVGASRPAARQETERRPDTFGVGL